MFMKINFNPERQKKDKIKIIIKIFVQFSAVWNRIPSIMPITISLSMFLCYAFALRLRTYICTYKWSRYLLYIKKHKCFKLNTETAPHHQIKSFSFVLAFLYLN